MATLDRVEIMAVGTWNGTEFTADDLDEMARAFDDEQQSGRLPVKLGHNTPDNDPALGWMTKVWREGDRLLATLSDVSEHALQCIRQGSFRFCSVELLRNVTTAAGRTYRMMLDGLALLGAARPAVEVLRPLHSSLSRGMRVEQRLAFTREMASVGEAAADDLQRENARLRAALHRQSIDAAVEGDVRAKLVMPAAREQFARLFRLSTDADYQRVSVNDWHTFRASQPRPPTSTPATRSDGESASRALSPDVSLVEKTRAYLRENELRHLQLTGERLTFGRAAEIVVRANPQLLAAWRVQNGEADY
jgi:hypothetical protein